MHQQWPEEAHLLPQPISTTSESSPRRSISCGASAQRVPSPAVPRPSCPQSFAPQAYTSPASDRASVWLFPAATATTRSPCKEATGVGTGRAAAAVGEHWCCRLHPQQSTDPAQTRLAAVLQRILTPGAELCSCARVEGSDRDGHGHA